MAIDLKQSPYFDDFNAENKYYRILFRPGRPVQARELNGLQSQIQEQIARFGSHIFANGSQVLPGNEGAVTFANNLGFIKINRIFAAQDQAAIENLWLGKVIKSVSAPNDVRAKVIGYRIADTLNEVRLFVEYINADSVDGTQSTFLPGQSISTEEEVSTSAVISDNDTSVGTASSVEVKKSVYFFNGEFLLVDEQRIFLEPSDPTNQAAWTNKPTAKIGLKVVRSIASFIEDETLGDNALPSDNYGAPGADRLYVECALTQVAYDAQNDGSFIDLLKVLNGEIQFKVSKTAYSVLVDTMARRTFDESGDYTVREFAIDIRPFLKIDNNRGAHQIDEYRFDTQAEAEAAGLALFGISAASLDPSVPDKWLPASSYAKFLELCDSKLTVQIDPGKAYVKGYEIETLAPTYIDINKARDLRFQNNKTVKTQLGNFVYITNCFGAPELYSDETIDLFSVKIDTAGVAPSASLKIGTARVLAVEHFIGTHGDSDAVYKLFLADIQAIPGKNLGQLKGVYSGTGSTFSANTVLEFAELQGSVSASGSSLVGNGTSWVNRTSQSLAVGDYVRVGNNNAQIFRVTVVNSDTSIGVSPTPTFTGNQTVEYAFSAIQGLNEAANLVFPLPNQFAYTLRGANGDNTINDSVIDTVFSVRRAFTASSDGAGVIHLTTTLADEEFEFYSSQDYLVVDLSTGDWIRLASGTSYNSGFATAGVEVVSPTVVNIHANPADAGNQYYVIASVRKTQGLASKELSKTLIRGTFVDGVYTGPYVVSDSGRSDLNTLNLGKADILKVSRIVMAPDFNTEPSNAAVLPAGHADITDRFLVDNGQRDYYYGLGAVTLKSTAERPKGRIRVEFDYFTHSSPAGSIGTYFSVDSYPFKGANANMDYAEIPKFIDLAGREYDLRDCIDCRRRVNDSGDGFSNAIEIPRSNIRVDFHHYLHRTDKLYLNKFGAFKTTKGTSDISPLPPEDPQDGMVLYVLDLQAYTATPDECFKKRIDNRRYTMRDIGRLENRITNLEYYTLLSLAEKETKDFEIKDAQGVDRFKNGFLVDNFSSHTIGNASAADYRCSIDLNSRELRPSVYQGHTSLFEKALLESNEILRETARIFGNYQKTGKLYTLRYTNTPFVVQELCSQIQNVNPYQKFTFRGRIALDPATDTWRETQVLPKLEVYDSTAYDAAVASLPPGGTIWGEWTMQWTKTDVEEHKQRKLIGRGKNKPDKNHKHNWPRYIQNQRLTIETTTTGLIRQGIEETVVPKGTVTQSLGNRIVQILASEFMRARTIAVTGKGFLPNARLYPFFDDRAVSNYCYLSNPTNKGEALIADGQGNVNFKFDLPGGIFKTGERIFALTTNANNAKNPQPASDGSARYVATGWIDQKQETELTIRQFEVHREAVAEKDSLVNKKTKLEESWITIEDPIAQSFVIEEKGGCFITAVDVFFYSKDPLIPVKLQLRPLSDDGFPTFRIMPFGEVVKPAADVVTNVVNLDNGTMTVTGNGSTPGFTVGPWNGSTANQNEIERVQAVSGRVIPNGTAIPLSANPHRDMIPTRFVFESPIYVGPNQQYAIVLLADSVNYEVWVSQAGPITDRPGETKFGDSVNTIIGTNTPILKDPFINGVLFMSSNGVTWNPDQLMDMKFAVHKAQFVTNQTGTIDFLNEELPLRALKRDPIETFDGSNKVRVHHPNHGMPALANPPARVVLSGVESANGIDVELLCNTDGWPIENVQLDSYVITVVNSSNATASGRTGGTGIYASENLSFDSLYLIVNQLAFPETEAFWTIATTNGGNVSYADLKNLPFVVNASREVSVNQTVEFSNPMTISSAINEYNAGDEVVGPSKVVTNGLGDRKSLRLRGVLRSTNPNLSPVIDEDRIAAITIAARIDNPVGAGFVGGDLEEDNQQIVPTTTTPAVSSVAGLVKFYNDASGDNKGKFSTTNADAAQHLSKLQVGRLVSISGTTSNARDCNNIVVLSVKYTPDASVKCTVVVDHVFGGSTGTEAANFSLIQKSNFISEIAPVGGSCSFKYMTRRITLARQSTALHVSFDAYRHESCDLEVYYKVLRVDDTTPFDDLNWVQAEFNLQVNADLVKAYPAANDFDDEMSAYEATINNIPPFLTYAIKIVARGGNSAKSPVIKNLKAIALDE